MPLAAGTYFIRVEERGTNAVIPNYYLDVRYLTDRLAESEAPNTTGTNETPATASQNLINGSNVFVFGDHQQAADADVYAISVPIGWRIRAEVVEGNRTVETCESNGLDSRLTLFDDTGAVVVDDDDDGRGFCSKIDGTGAVPVDVTARNGTRTARTYYLMVRRSDFAVGQEQNFVYRLTYNVTPPR
jgi:hypothetical protein